MFFLSAIIQKPTPQLKVFSISLSDIFLDLSQEKILFILKKSNFIFYSLFNRYWIQFDLKKIKVYLINMYFRVPNNRLNG